MPKENVAHLEYYFYELKHMLDRIKRQVDASSEQNNHWAANLKILTGDQLYYEADLYNQWTSKEENHIEAIADGQDAIDVLQAKINETVDTIACIRAQVDAFAAATENGQPLPVLPPPLILLSGAVNTNSNQAPINPPQQRNLLHPPSKSTFPSLRSRNITSTH